MSTYKYKTHTSSKVDCDSTICNTVEACTLVKKHQTSLCLPVNYEVKVIDVMDVMHHSDGAVTRVVSHSPPVHHPESRDLKRVDHATQTSSVETRLPGVKDKEGASVEDVEAATGVRMVTRDCRRTTETQIANNDVYL